MNRDDSKRAAEFDRVLVQREQELCALLGAREAQIDSAGAALDVSDFKDLAAQESMAVVDEAQAEHAAHELEQVLAARRRLLDHSYGFCLDCGQAIDWRRLAAMPATSCCTSCQSAREWGRQPAFH